MGLKPKLLQWERVILLIFSKTMQSCDRYYSNCSYSSPNIIILTSYSNRLSSGLLYNVDCETNKETVCNIRKSNNYRLHTLTGPNALTLRKSLHPSLLLPVKACHSRLSLHWPLPATLLPPFLPSQILPGCIGIWFTESFCLPMSNPTYKLL